MHTLTHSKSILDSAYLLALSERLMADVKLQHFGIVLKEIQTWPQDQKVLRRMAGHLRAKIELVKTNYSRALEILKETMENEGPHLLLWADLVACYYLNKQFAAWKLSVKDLDLEMKKINLLVNPINRHRAEIILAKSFEIQGSIYEAYQKYLSLYESSEMNFRIKGLSHLVRLEAQFPLSTDFSLHYLELKHFAYGAEQPDYDSDVLHSLLMAEAEHIDIQLAKNTLHKIPRSQICFFALGFYELLDIYLRRNPWALSELEQEFQPVLPQTPMDEKLLLLASNQFPTDWYSWIHHMPLTQYFRLVRFILKQLPPKDRAICLEQIHLMLKGLSHESRVLWIRFFEKEGVFSHSNYNNTIEWNKDEQLILNGITIHFGRQHLIKKLLSLTIPKKEVSFEIACRELWNCTLDESYQHRLRHLVQRINKITKKEALSEILKASGNKIQVI